MGFVLENILTVVVERVLRGGAEEYGIGLELRGGGSDGGEVGRGGGREDTVGRGFFRGWGGLATVHS